jgi:hypothetical protein
MMATHLSYLPQAFGIGMRSEGPANESLAAEWAATELGVPYNATVLEDEDFISEWPTVLGQLSEPIANSSALMIGMMCERVGEDTQGGCLVRAGRMNCWRLPRHLTERLYRLPGPPSVEMSRGGLSATRSAARSCAFGARSYRDTCRSSVLPPDTTDELVRGASATAAELAREAPAVGRAGRSRDPVNDFFGWTRACRLQTTC